MFITAEQALSIKEKIKQEMLRRNLRGATINFGSLADYGSTKYDFTIPPAPKQHIKTEVGEKTINLLYSAIEDLQLPMVTSKTKIVQNFNLLEDYVSLLETESIEGNSSSCRGACSGLCFGSCIGGCNGCSGTCSSGCQGCTATCGSGCANSYMYA